MKAVIIFEAVVAPTVYDYDVGGVEGVITIVSGEFVQLYTSSVNEVV